jgi:hypothetical protein
MRKLSRSQLASLAAATIALVSSPWGIAQGQLLGQGQPLGQVDEPLDSVFLSVCSALDCGEFSHFPATGQTTKYLGGDDGDVKKGAPLSYTDNGNGTITDNATGLMWEAKTNCDITGSGTDLHDGDNSYPWSGFCSGLGPCGTNADCPTGQTCIGRDGQGTNMTIFMWVAALNAGSFAGHNDWRIPNIRELESIVDFGTSSPATASAFNSGAGSCTENIGSKTYWSSTTDADMTGFAWAVYFGDGSLASTDKGVDMFRHVRAVRGGL